MNDYHFFSHFPKGGNKSRERPNILYKYLNASSNYTPSKPKEKKRDSSVSASSIHLLSHVILQYFLVTQK